MARLDGGMYNRIHTLKPRTVPAFTCLTFSCNLSASTVFHCIGTNSIEFASGVALGDQLYSQVTFEPGLVNGKTASVLWFSTGQQRPRLE